MEVKFCKVFFPMFRALNFNEIEDCFNASRAIEVPGPHTLVMGA